VKKGGDKVTLRILRRKVNVPSSSSGVKDDAAERVQEQASKERAVVGAMAGLGREMDVDVDGGSSSSSSSTPSNTPSYPTRPLKLLLHSADGYTESSLAALCLLMSVKGLTLPEAYLDLQIGKRRSFSVYQLDMGVVRRVETRLTDDREREREGRG
jgi:hypothetical protein